MEFPITLEALRTVAGVAVLASVVILWLNHYVPENKKFITNILALAICEAVAFLATFVFYAWQPSAEALLITGLVGLFGTTLQCYGYEALKNILNFGKPTE